MAASYVYVGVRCAIFCVYSCWSVVRGVCAYVAVFRRGWAAWLFFARMCYSLVNANAPDSCRTEEGFLQLSHVPMNMKYMDTLGIEPRAFRMRSSVIPLHHVPTCFFVSKPSASA